MKDYIDDTIASIATAKGEGGIGIVRISGDLALEIAKKIFRPKSQKKDTTFTTHKVQYGTVVDIEGNPLDEVILLPMLKPNSYTKEDVVEIQCHGGPLVLKEILALVLSCGARLSDKGEFTKRAFLNGRIDLSQAQSVMDIISAKNKNALMTSLNSLKGGLKEKIEALRHDILGLIAHFEASIDFPEDDIEDLAKDEAYRKIVPMISTLEELEKSYQTGKILKDGLLTAIIGKPNVGKSSLLNNILKEDRAIVTDIPGTTRDCIEEYVNFGDVPLRIIDTAGIRDTEDVVEKIGVDKSKKYLKEGELILALFDSSRVLDKEDEEIIHNLKDKRGIALLTKSDLTPQITKEILAEKINTAGGEFKIISISNYEEDSLKALEEEVEKMVFNGDVPNRDSIYINTLRQLEALTKSKEHLKGAISAMDIGLSEDFITIDLKSAWENLGKLSGDAVEEDIIDEIFSQFCIGK